MTAGIEEVRLNSRDEQSYTTNRYKSREARFFEYSLDSTFLSFIEPLAYLSVDMSFLPVSGHEKFAISILYAWSCDGCDGNRSWRAAGSPR